MLRRDNWHELGDEYVLAINKWTSDREALATSLKETGWFFSVGAAISAAEAVPLIHVWSGVDADSGDIVLCEEDGDGGALLEVSPITIADVAGLID